MFTRVILIVLDSVGIGELPDAADYGDQGSNTLGNMARRQVLQIPTLASLGLSRLVPLPGVPMLAVAAGRVRPARRALGGQGLGHRPLGADGRGHRSAVPDLSRWAFRQS